MESDIHESAVAVCSDRRDTGDHVWVKHSVANDAETTWSLGDQHVAVRQECDRPWMRKLFSHDTHTDFVLLGSVEYPGSFT